MSETKDALKANAAQVRHKKRGSTYDVIGVGKMQAETWAEPEGAPIFAVTSVDMREVVVYRSTEDGSIWVRPREEFEDGRFEPALSVEQAPQPPSPETHLCGSALRAHYERELTRIIAEWEERRDVLLADEEAKGRFLILRSFELAAEGRE